MTPTLRDAGPDDRPFLLALFASTREQELSQVLWPAEVREVFLRLQFSAQATDYAQRHPDSRCQVIEHDGRPVGRLWVARGAHALRVLDISLLPEARGRGIGTDCLRRVLADAAATGRAVDLQLAAASPARRLCERLGLRPVGQGLVYQAMRWTPFGAPHLDDFLALPHERA